MNASTAALTLAQTAAPESGAGGLLAGSSPLALALILGALSVLPFIALVGTSFVKVSIVLGLVRNAIGTPQVPSNAVITGLAAILSLHIMAPTGAAIVAAAGPQLDRALAADLSRPEGVEAAGQAWEAAKAPIRRFLRANASPRDRALFYDLARRARSRPAPPDASAAPDASVATATPPTPDDLAVLLPAFVVSELTSAFAIGFLVFLPFLIVDLVIANLLTALGMQTVAPATVALPFKLLLLILADGWYLIARALVLGYR